MFEPLIIIRVSGHRRARVRIIAVGTGLAEFVVGRAGLVGSSDKHELRWLERNVKARVLMSKS